MAGTWAEQVATGGIRLDRLKTVVNWKVGRKTWWRRPGGVPRDYLFVATDDLFQLKKKKRKRKGKI